MSGKELEESLPGTIFMASGHKNIDIKGEAVVWSTCKNNKKDLSFDQVH
ncbi:MAG: hypothetical protein HYS17_03915 [Micavibrio aeruginosavorus]|uniref:Uncharacterized protein n=1 Tax=Micavibrio aeruginosavorus TaxID=349221 RepID=A0A7T5R3Q3_9BACT|nr:MAG: hypothetical protein HYS17_03915 [Micavibrio aeruginosavorus]